MAERPGRLRRWTAQQLRDVQSMYHFIGHIERDAEGLGLREVARLMAMATLVIEDELAAAEASRRAVLTLVKP
ncbi:MAG TPA: hypothetical protein VMU42_18115 [Candidatus Sulfotelmatobacter sp.]|nr:hypothetical protein [Candidatus Sulfotelmatobacter sp.]